MLLTCSRWRTPSARHQVQTIITTCPCHRLQSLTRGGGGLRRRLIRRSAVSSLTGSLPKALAVSKLPSFIRLVAIPKRSRLPFLGPDWSAVVAETKRYADSIGLGCDFTFVRSAFGGSFVPDADRTRIYGDPDWRQSWRLSWEHGTPGNVLNHLDSSALERYASRVGGALEPALKGSTSALFCDSWEVESRRIWTEGFGDRFEDRFGYRIEPFMDTLYEPDTAGPRYDYMALVSDTVLDQFFRPFTRICHELNAVSRVQCAGAPADILAAYAAIDIPESEAMLYEPGFARIPASAAAMTSRQLVSAETFTCLYGFPGEHIRQENVFDLKRVADAMFAMA